MQTKLISAASSGAEAVFGALALPFDGVPPPQAARKKASPKAVIFFMFIILPFCSLKFHMPNNTAAAT